MPSLCVCLLACSCSRKTGGFIFIQGQRTLSWDQTKTEKVYQRNKSAARQPASQSMSSGGWQQVLSPRHIGESMVAGSANCALGSHANSASLAVSVCQRHLGRTALRTYSTSPHLRGHRLTHTHTCMDAHKKARADTHSTCM